MDCVLNEPLEKYMIGKNTKAKLEELMDKQHKGAKNSSIRHALDMSGCTCVLGPDTPSAHVHPSGVPAVDLPNLKKLLSQHRKPFLSLHDTYQVAGIGDWMVSKGNVCNTPIGAIT